MALIPKWTVTENILEITVRSSRYSLSVFWVVWHPVSGTGCFVTYIISDCTLTCKNYYGNCWIIFIFVKRFKELFKYLTIRKTYLVDRQKYIKFIVCALLSIFYLILFRVLYFWIENYIHTVYYIVYLYLLVALQTKLNDFFFLNIFFSFKSNKNRGSINLVVNYFFLHCYGLCKRHFAYRIYYFTIWK